MGRGGQAVQWTGTRFTRGPDIWGVVEHGPQMVVGNKLCDTCQGAFSGIETTKSGSEDRGVAWPARGLLQTQGVKVRSQQDPQLHPIYPPLPVRQSRKFR